MINGKKIIIVLSAYNAETTLEKTYSEIPFEVVDDVILVDHHSSDNSFEFAGRMGIHHIIQHSKNAGYGATQKICFNQALALGADIVVMLHAGYQYTPRLISSMCHLIASDTYPVVLGSRILGARALRAGMPLYKYAANRILTFIQNIAINQKLSEYHSGYVAYSKKVLQAISYNQNSDDFLFDNQLLTQVFASGFKIGEITCPTCCFRNSSSINLWSSVIYGLGVLKISFLYLLTRIKIYRHPVFGNVA